MFEGWVEFVRDCLLGFTFRDLRSRAPHCTDNTMLMNSAPDNNRTISDVIACVTSQNYALESCLLMSTCKKFWTDGKAPFARMPYP